VEKRRASTRETDEADQWIKPRRLETHGLVANAEDLSLVKRGKKSRDESRLSRLESLRHPLKKGVSGFASLGYTPVLCRVFRDASE